MADADRARWDERHARRAAAGDDAGSGRFLAWIAPHLPARGLALDVACGRGGSAAWLAGHGFTVDAVDVSLVALSEARRLAASRGLARAVRTFVHDLDSGLPLGLGPFDLVFVAHFHAPRLWDDLRRSLAPGGLLAIETLTTRNADLGIPAPPARYLVEPGGLRAAANGLDVILHEETFDDGRHVERVLARRRREPGASGAGSYPAAFPSAGPRGGASFV